MPRIAAPRGAILDPTSDPVDNTVTKIGVDATKPGAADFAERLTIADDQRARVRKVLSAAGIRILTAHKYNENRDVKREIAGSLATIAH